MSPDGRYVLVGTRHYGHGDHLELMRPYGGGLTRVARIPLAAQPGEWSVDGKEVAFLALTDNRTELLRMRIDGGTISPVAAARPLAARPVGWVPGSRDVFYFSCTHYVLKDCEAGDVMAVAAGGGVPRVVVSMSGRNAGRSFLWSPDGNWIARGAEDCSTASCRETTFVVSAATGAQQARVAGRPVTWTPDSGRLLVADAKSRLVEVSVLGGSARQVLEAGVNPPMSDPRGLWDRPGQRVALATPDGIVVLDRSGRMLADFREHCAPPPGGCSEYDGGLSWTPDGNSVLYARRAPYRGPGKREGGIYLLDIRTGKSTLLLADTVEW
jgi:hypothetical protein